MNTMKTHPEINDLKPAQSQSAMHFGTAEVEIRFQTLSPCRRWPAQVIVDPSRLHSGLWGYIEGDISAAYCADTFPKIQTFGHEGQRYTVTACHHQHGKESVDAYPLILASEYRGPEPMQYTYEGRAVSYNGRSYRLGPKVKFVSRDRTIPEWIDLFRRQYAYGGYFVSGKTYAQMLTSFFEEAIDDVNRTEAICAELNSSDLPERQEEMRTKIETPPARIGASNQAQLSLGFE
jgi:hypothetical protein